MRKVNSYSSLLVVVLLCILQLSVLCHGDDEGNVSAPMERIEKDALYSTIQSFVGNSWNGSNLYPDPCGWTPIQGVGCDVYDGLWYVTDLSIGPVHENSLTCAQNVEFNSNLFSLKHLKSLSFFKCFVSPPGTNPNQNWRLLGETLESLEFRSNPGLTGNIPESFGELVNLQSLVLTDNGLTGRIPSSIGKLALIKRLNLAGNKLSGNIPDSIMGLNNLLILDLSRNLLSGFLNMSVEGFGSLLKLDLNNNKLEGKIPAQIRYLKNLTLLDLSNNKLSGGLTNSIQELTSLEELLLSNNPNIGGDLMTVAWTNLRKLIALDLSNTSLTGVIPDSIADLKGLRFLGLHDNKLTGDISPKLETLPNVTAIYVHGNNLSGELKFSQGFYGKMGRRFGAWNNTNLCYYSVGLVATSYAPFGVNSCEGKVTKFDPVSKLKFGSGGDINYVASLGCSTLSGFSGLVFVVEICIVIVFNSL